MKKASVVTFVLLGSIYLASAQTLQKGNILAIHQSEVKLKEGATIEEYATTWDEKVFPAYQVALEDIEIHNIMGLRGECQNCPGFMMIIESTELRDKYWKKDGTWTDYALKKLANVQPALETLAKLGTYTSIHTDWLVDPSVKEYLEQTQNQTKK